MTGNPTDPAALARRLAPSAPSSDADAASVAASVPEKEGRPIRPDSCGEFDIRIAADGQWFYHGSPITRKPLVKLFASVLRRDEAGEFWLETPAEKGRIRVDDAPFVAVELAASSSGQAQELTFRTNLDEFVTAGPEHHIYVRESGAAPRPYIAVRDGLDALIARPVFYQLVELGVARERPGAAPELGVWSRGEFFPLGRLDETKSETGS